MKSHEVIKNAVEEPGVKAVAATLKVSAALVYKWCEPPADPGDPDQSGARNPLDRVRDLYTVTRDIRLVRWLCNQAGGFFVANPAPADKSHGRDHAFYVQTRGLVRDFSHLLDTVTESVEDDQSVDDHEAEQIRQRWEDLKANLEHFVTLCETGHFRIKKPR
ncbi:MAG TPA: phage regulatory CII family protein [Tepidisphaeraceae bacterium]|jgi:hypothetical protein